MNRFPVHNTNLIPVYNFLAVLSLSLEEEEQYCSGVFVDLHSTGSMDAQAQEDIPRRSRVKASFRLGSEAHLVNTANKGTLSEQLISMKEESMAILKEYITKHNVPNDVPDELVEEASEDDDEVTEKPRVLSKKTKLT